MVVHQHDLLSSTTYLSTIERLAGMRKRPTHGCQSKSRCCMGEVSMDKRLGLDSRGVLLPVKDHDANVVSSKR